MKNPEATIRVAVDVTNPGQFFACCGLLELADRLCPGAEGWFEQTQFCIAAAISFQELMVAASTASLVQLDPDNNTSSPMLFGQDSWAIRLDWWLDKLAGGRDLKVWAGTMESVRIARAMQGAVQSERFHGPDLFDVGMVVYDTGDPPKKVEPFYFDARRGPNAHSRDVGFSPNDLQVTTTAFPAVEFLCLIGLQRCLPARKNRSSLFDYYTWSQPIPTTLLPAVVAGKLWLPHAVGYRFENWYRTGQKKHKAFRTGIPLT